MYDRRILYVYLEDGYGSKGPLSWETSNIGIPVGLIAQPESHSYSWICMSIRNTMLGASPHSLLEQRWTALPPRREGLKFSFYFNLFNLILVTVSVNDNVGMLAPIRRAEVLISWMTVLTVLPGLMAAFNDCMANL